jgi:hypothetical protein
MPFWARLFRSSRLHSRDSTEDSLRSAESDQGSGRRPLTPPLPETERSRSSSNQLQSPFFAKLPLEIREQIYRYVVAPPDSRRFHVSFAGGRFWGRRCLKDGLVHTRCWAPPKITQSPSHGGSPGSEICDLLCSCRFMWVLTSLKE